MANPNSFLIAANDEHGQNPPTVGKRTPTMPYIDQSFYENEFNRPAKYNFLLACLRTGFNVYDVKPELQDISITTRVNRTNRQRATCLVTFAYNAIGNGNTFNDTNGQQVFYGAESRYTTQSRLLAFDVTSGLAQATGLKNLGIGRLFDVGVLSSVNCPSVLAECGFMTNFNEAKLMIDPDFQRQCGDGACIGICNELEVNYLPNVSYTQLPTIRRGDKGKGVQYLQCYLNLYGETLDVDGNFGAKTQTAVEQFQRQNNLLIDGIVGQNTWRTLLMQRPLPLLKKGSTGVFVRYAQQKLVSKLYLADDVDGIFGNKTQQATKDFQQENGLVSDGIIGPLTWAKLSAIGGGRGI